LEPNANPAGEQHKQALLKQNIPATTFEIDNLSQEVERLKICDVEFSTEPTNAGGLNIAASGYLRKFYSALST
jgi:hypothetical protein